MSFDVEGLFTNVPLEHTINLILEKVYTKKLIKTKLTKKQMGDLLRLCTTGLHFTFDNEVYRQVDGVAMGSPLGPVLANVFMVELEEQLVPTLQQEMPLWYRYVDDTFTFIKDSEVEKIQQTLNAFHPSIKFTWEKEVDEKIAFLDVSIIRSTNGLSTNIYRKKTDTNIYINWNSFSPQVWKIGTLKGLVKRAYVVCSEETMIKKEIEFLQRVFIRINQYPKNVVIKTIENVKNSLNNTSNAPNDGDTNNEIENENVANQNVANEENVEEEIKPYMVLQYAGKQGESIVTDLKKCFVKYLPANVKPRISYTGKKLGSFFRVKDNVKKEHKTDLIYEYDSSKDRNCKTKCKYVGETNVRYETRVSQHVNTNTAVHAHAASCGHEVSVGSFSILDTNYGDDKKRKLAEALYIRDGKPELNKQVRSHKLYLFN